MTTLPDHLAICDGGLYDTRPDRWTAQEPVRLRYRGHFNGEPFTLEHVKAALREGAFTSVGGYPVFFITRDGAALSFEAVRERWREIVSDHLDGYGSWRIAAVDVNYEDSELVCDHTGRAIPSAYGED